MTSEQKRLVSESFAAISEVALPLSQLFYGRLFEMDPRLRPLFREDIELQGRKLMEMLTAIATDLDRFESLAEVLKALGQKHAGYGVRSDDYESFKTALIWAFGQALLGEFHPELQTAWRAVLDAVGTVMKAGAATPMPDHAA